MDMYERWIDKFEIKPGSWVFVPSPQAKEQGKQIKAALESQWSPPDYYFHLRDGGHVAALRTHIENNRFIHLDIKNFFGAINRSRVTRALKTHFAYQQARNMAIQSTVRVPNTEPKEYMLPFGFVQSPLIASRCLSISHLAKYLDQLYNNTDIQVSVYMDDIIISAKSDKFLESVLSTIKDKAEKSGFPLNADKEEGPANSVTAFNIELSHNNLLIEDKRLKEFIVAYWKSQSEHQIFGILGYIDSVNEEQAMKVGPFLT